MEILESSAMLLMLLNPFLVILYLIDVVKKQNKMSFSHNIFKAAFWSSIVFVIFALVGDFIFKHLVVVEFESFQIFGGIIFLIVGIQFVLKGTNAIDSLRGDSENVSSSIAMPILIGPGTISVSVLIGKRLSPVNAVISIIATVFISAGTMVLLKFFHDYIKPRKEALIEKYMETAGRIMSLYIGAFSINMIMSGVGGWIEKFSHLAK